MGLTLSYLLIHSPFTSPFLLIFFPSHLLKVTLICALNILSPFPYSSHFFSSLSSLLVLFFVPFLPFLSLHSSLHFILHFPSTSLSPCAISFVSPFFSPAFSLSISPLAFPSLSSSSWIVTRLGGFFIKRRLDSSSGKDVLYRKCLHEVIQLI